MAASIAWTSYREQVRQLADRLVELQRPIRVREAIHWDDSFEHGVLASRFKQLPAADRDYYQTRRPLPFDPPAKLAEFEHLKGQIERQLPADDPLAAILLRNCAQYQDVIRMLL